MVAMEFLCEPAANKMVHSSWALTYTSPFVIHYEEEWDNEIYKSSEVIALPSVNSTLPETRLSYAPKNYERVYDG